MSSHAATEAEPATPGPGFARRHLLLLVALGLVLLVHGTLLLSGSYQRTYDAYVHIFFADHYRRDWFSSWDDRWYTGFSVLSYPPGGHVAIAALSHVVGLRTGFAVVQLFALLNLTVGVYRWSRLWVSDTAAGAAAILLVLSSSIAETVHVFGQLPTTLSLGFLLNALPFADRWLRTGRRRSLLAAVSVVMATTACHHVTTLFGGVFFLGPVVVAALFAALRAPRDDEPHGAAPGRLLLRARSARRGRRALPVLVRTGVLGVLVLVALVGVVLPYWLLSSSDPILQVTIPHGSRENFLVNRDAGLMFWVVPWGVLLLAVPYALVRGLGSAAWPLAASLALLAFLGTGGTTPYPKLLLGPAYEILTLDRFTFWATICVLPLAGQLVVSLVGGSLRSWLVTRLGRGVAGLLTALVATAYLAAFVVSASLTHLKPFQPPALDMAPIVTFLGKDDHDQWRYLTLGFGDQMAWLGAQTTAESVDGDYHSARKLPELTTRPVERIEGAKYSGFPGIGSLQQFLETPSRYSLKYVFVNDQFYSPLLAAEGWTPLGDLENGVAVWERSDVPPLPQVRTDPQAPAWQRLLWGTVPPGSLLLATLLLTGYGLGAIRAARPRGRVLRRAEVPVAERALPARAWAGLRGGADAVLGPPRRLVARLVGAPYRRVDGWLLRHSAPLGQDAADTADLARERREELGFVRRFRHSGARRVPTWRRRLQAGVVLAVLALVAGLGVRPLLARPDAEPADVVAAYYRALDLRDFAGAWALLDPRTRPPLSTFSQDATRDGGLVASFSKLVDVTPEVRLTGSQAEVRTRLEYLTALSRYTVTAADRLLRLDGAWVLVPPTPDPTRSPRQFTSRPQVGFLSEGRRGGTQDITSARDVLDRPELVLDQVRSLRRGERWIVVGRVTNVDVDPADVTVTGVLRDRRGTLLATWDAGEVLDHTLLPGEASVFRVEFQSVAGTAPSDQGSGDTVPIDPAIAATASAPAGGTASTRGPVEFDPDTITPLVLDPDATVARVEVYAKAVVTPVPGQPVLQGGDLRVRRTDAGWVLSGLLRNDGTVEVAVPHLLLGLDDAQGRLAWVQHAYLPRSLPPQTELPFRLLLDEPSGRDGGVPTAAYAGPAQTPPATPPFTTLDLPAASGWSRVTVQPTGYVRGGVDR